MTRLILSWYTGVCAALVLIVQGLSVFHLIMPLPFLICAAAVALATAAVMKMRPRAPRVRTDDFPRIFHPLVLPFALVLPLIAVISFALGWHVPPNNWDAMTYHLSRAAYWRQWHTLAHFPTNNWRQDAFPGNAEVLLLVTLLVAHSAKLAFMVQFTAYIAAALAVYGLGRQMGVQPVYALAGAGLFATMPEVVLQSTSAQNDLTVAAFIVCAVYFLVDAVQQHRGVSIILMGAALGLAIGTKPTAALPLPGLLVGAAALVWPLRHKLHVTKDGLVTASAALLVAALLGAPWYVANKAYFGQFGGPPDITQTQEVAHPTVTTLRVNVLRYIVAFVDPAGPALLNPATSAVACSGATELRVRLAAAFHEPPVEPAVEWPGTTYSSAPTCFFGEDTSWFGLAGCLAVMIALVCAIAGILARKPGLAWLLAAGATSFLVSGSLLLRWQPWQGRLVITMVALSSPLVGLLAQKLSSYRAGRLALHSAVLYAVAGGLATAADNSAKPVWAWGVSPATLQTFTRPDMGSVLQSLARTVPANGRMGIFLDGDDWDFPLFGPHLDRYVQPLILPPGANRYLTHVRPGTLGYILTHQAPPAVRLLLQDPRLSHCSMLWSIGQGNGAAPWQLFRCGAHTAS